MGHIISSFIDDTPISHNTFEGCYESTHAAVEFLRKIGFCINNDKSVLVPIKLLEYLGNVIDSNAMRVTLPERRQRKIVQSCKQLFNGARYKIRDVAKVIGLLVAAIPAVEMGKLHYRSLETLKISALKKEKGNFDK